MKHGSLFDTARMVYASTTDMPRAGSTRTEDLSYKNHEMPVEDLLRWLYLFRAVPAEVESANSANNEAAAD